jgi:hypothetical protein
MAAKSSKSKSAGEAHFEGHELNVNPSPNTSLKRKKARKARIKQTLDNAKLSPEKRAYLERAIKRIELEIKLAEGDY